MRLRTYTIFAICVLAAACGGGDDGDDGGPPTGDHYHYVVDSAAVPTNTSEAQTYGLDIDCGEASMDDCPDGTDVTKDNQLGSVLAALAGMGFDVQGTIDTAVNEGSLLLLVDFQTTAFDSAGRSGLKLFLGNTADGAITPEPCTTATPPVCGQHLMGTGMFSIAPGSPTNALVAGPVVGGVFRGGPGTLTLQIALAAGMPIDLSLIGARAEARTLSATGIGSGVIAGAIPKTDIDNNIIPAIATQLDGVLTEDMCGTAPPPLCGCMADSTGATLIDLFDANEDCEVSVMEIQTNGLIMSLLAPDVTIDGVDALSIGLGFSAVGGTFTAP